GGIKRCLTALARRVCWTGRGRPWTQSAFAPRGGRTDRAQQRGSGRPAWRSTVALGAMQSGWEIAGVLANAVASLGTLGALIVAVAVYRRQVADARSDQASRVFVTVLVGSGGWGGYDRFQV